MENAARAPPSPIGPNINRLEIGAKMFIELTPEQQAEIREWKDKIRDSDDPEIIAYKKMLRYQVQIERDVKLGRTVKDKKTGRLTSYPAKEISLEHLEACTGHEMADTFDLIQYVEDKEEVLQREAQLALVMEEVKKLSPEARELLTELFWERKSITTIAREKGVSLQAICQKRDRIFGRIRKNLKKL